MLTNSVIGDGSWVICLVFDEPKTNCSVTSYKKEAIDLLNMKNIPFLPRDQQLGNILHVVECNVPQMRFRSVWSRMAWPMSF